MNCQSNPSSGSVTPLKAWWLATRPATLWISVIPVLLGSSLAYVAGQWAWKTLLLAVASTTWIQIGTNLFNDYADFKSGADTHERLGPARATQQGWIAPRTVLIAAMISFALAMVCGIELVQIGGWPIAVIGVVGILCGIAYTGGPVPLGYRGFGDILVFVFFGLIAVSATYFLHTGDVSLVSLLVGAGIGCWSTAVIVLNNLRDRTTDIKAGKRTLAVRFGATFARCEYAALLALAYVAVAMGAVLQGNSDVCASGVAWSWFLPWLTLPHATRLMQRVRYQEGAAINPSFIGTARLETVFGLLWVVGILL